MEEILLLLQVIKPDGGVTIVTTGDQTGWRIKPDEEDTIVITDLHRKKEGFYKKMSYPSDTVPVKYERETYRSQTTSERRIPTYSDYTPYDHRFNKYDRDIPTKYSSKPLTYTNTYSTYNKDIPYSGYTPVSSYTSRPLSYTPVSRYTSRPLSYTPVSSYTSRSFQDTPVSSYTSRPFHYTPVSSYTRRPFTHNSRLSNKPTTSDGNWTTYDKEMTHESDEIRKEWEDTFKKVAPRADAWSLADTISKRMVPVTESDDWITGGDSKPHDFIVQDATGKRTFFAEFDLSQFKPEEIKIKTTGSYLTIRARHQDRDPSNSSKREYSREILLPDEVSTDFITSKLSRTGKLTLEAPIFGSQRTNRDVSIPVEYGY
ncbi:CRYAB [Mytilus coruscus]|uniref:CRYAB n=1 Tax=Mytilus coruscus TaxID=42192 RepID=A0A6J8ASI9_MYTCO|nr:CRYAB [Mytilus coruscus]